MKVFINLFILLLSITMGYGQKWSAALGAAYGDDIESAGFHGRAYYNLPNGRICFGPEVSVFGGSSETIGNLRENRDLWEVNFNVHYVVELSHKFGFYPVTGINYSNETEDFFLNNERIETETIREWGVNLGAGFHYLINPKWIIFTEWDHLFSDLSQNSFTAGLFFTFGKGFGQHKGNSEH